MMEILPEGTSMLCCFSKGSCLKVKLSIFIAVIGTFKRLRQLIKIKTNVDRGTNKGYRIRH